MSQAKNRNITSLLTRCTAPDASPGGGDAQPRVVITDGALDRPRDPRSPVVSNESSVPATPTSATLPDAGPPRGRPLTRRGVMNFFAGSLAATAVVPAAVIAALPAGADPAESDDPIFAVIAEHKAAVEARSVAMHATFDFGGGPPDEPKNSPAHVAADKAHDEAFDREMKAFRALFDTTPTTVAGVAAMLAHFGSLQYPGNAGSELSGARTSVLRAAFESTTEDDSDLDNHLLATAKALIRMDAASVLTAGAPLGLSARGGKRCEDAELVTAWPSTQDTHDPISACRRVIRAEQRRGKSRDGRS
jgi:hypothetical protein